MLQKNPKALCAGSSELYIYFKHIEKMYQFGPYGPNHATAGTFAFKKELLNLVKKQELESAISFKGSQSNLNELFKNYDYLIQPTHMECFSLFKMSLQSFKAIMIKLVKTQTIIIKGLVLIESNPMLCVRKSSSYRFW